MDNLFLMRDIIDVSVGHDFNLGFLSIDQEKALIGWAMGICLAFWVSCPSYTYDTVGLSSFLNSLAIVSVEERSVRGLSS